MTLKCTLSSSGSVVERSECVCVRECERVCFAMKEKRMNNWKMKFSLCVIVGFVQNVFSYSMTAFVALIFVRIL